MLMHLLYSLRLEVRLDSYVLAQSRYLCKKHEVRHIESEPIAPGLLTPLYPDN
jgi:hypothetical protein